MKKSSMLIVVLLFLFGTAHAEPTIWYVHPDSILNTIKAALDSCENDDTVLVGPGTYYENIVWPNTQGIHLISELGSEMTIIDGDNAGRVITIASVGDPMTTIAGFTIQNGRTDTVGGGIACIRSSPSITGNTIMNNLVEGFPRSCGGGIACINSSPFIADNSIRNNVAGGCFINHGEGGGIACINSSPIIKDNSITHNLASGANYASGGGISCDSGSSPMIAYNHIADNDVSGYSAVGHAIACGEFSSPAIISNVITFNGGQYSYGTLLFSGASGTIIDNVIRYNHSVGIVCSWYSSPAIRGNTITENAASGIECREQSSPFIDSCTISENGAHGILCTASIYGSGYPTVIHCNIHGNSLHGIMNEASYQTINAEDNWWGDSTGPYHPDSNPGGQGDSVSDYVDFTPWLTDSVQWVGVEEQKIVRAAEKKVDIGATIFAGPLRLPADKKCRVFDITGRVVAPDKMKPGIYFIEVEGKITQKVVKIR